MKEKFCDVVERARILDSSKQGDRFGAFRLTIPGSKRSMLVLVSNGDDWQECGFKLPAWEHVSVSLPDRCPTWQEMCWVKDLFFDHEECVVQFHPPKKEYVNMHKHCLHLWKIVGTDFPRPPKETVGW